MRLEARVLEGGKQTKRLVPLATFIEFKQVHDRSVNDCITDKACGFEEWEPRVAWHTMTHCVGESRPFDEWCAAVEWVGIYGAPDALDPSGGEATPTPPSSPESSSEPDAHGQSSSPSTRNSRKRSG